MSTTNKLPYLRVSNTNIHKSFQKGFLSFSQLENGEVVSGERSVKLSRSKNKTENADMTQTLQHNKQTLRKLTQVISNQREQEYGQYIKDSNRYRKLLELNVRKSKLASILKGKIGQIKVKQVTQTKADGVDYQIEQKKVEVLGWKPEPREGQICVVYKDCMFAIGGQNNYPISGISVFSFRQNKWIKNIETDLNRSYHSGVLYKSYYVIIFGGMTSHLSIQNERQCMNTVCAFDLNYGVVKNVKIENEEIIEGRRCHAACIFGKSMVIFGGMNSKKKYLSDLKYLDLKHLKWFAKEMKYDSEELQYFLSNGIIKHTMFAHFNQRKNYPIHNSDYEQHEGIYIFGGVNSVGYHGKMMQIRLNKYMPVIYLLHTSGIPPSSIDPAILEYSQSRILIISGDRSSRQLKFFKIKEREYIGIINSNKLPSLGGLSTSLVGYRDSYYLFFGISDTEYISNYQQVKIKERKKAHHQKRKLTINSVFKQEGHHKDNVSEDASSELIYYD